MTEYLVVCPRGRPPQAARYVRRARNGRGNSTESIPLGRFFKMNFNNLLGIGDVVPLSVGLPAFRDNLNQNFSQGRIGNVRDALAVRFDVQLELLVFPKGSLFDVFQ